MRRVDNRPFGAGAVASAFPGHPGYSIDLANLLITKRFGLFRHTVPRGFQGSFGLEHTGTPSRFSRPRSCGSLFARAYPIVTTTLPVDLRARRIS